MIVEVMGVVLGITQRKPREGETNPKYETMIFQPGERENTIVVTEKQYKEGEKIKVTGKLSAWTPGDRKVTVKVLEI